MGTMVVAPPGVKVISHLTLTCLHPIFSQKWGLGVPLDFPPILPPFPSIPPSPPSPPSPPIPAPPLPPEAAYLEYNGAALILASTGIVLWLDAMNMITLFQMQRRPVLYCACCACAMLHHPVLCYTVLCHVESGDV